MNFSRFNLDPKRIPTSDGETSVVRFELSVRSLLLVLALIATVWLLMNLVPILLVLVTALMLVGALGPIVTWLEQRNVRRPFALCTIFGVAIALVVTLAMVTVPTVITQLRNLVENEPLIRERVAIYLQ